MKTLRTLGAVAATGMVLAILPAGAAMAADTGDTEATFTLTGGTLDVTVAGVAPLTDGNSGDTTITGDLGEVSVSDARGGVAGWVVSASSTAFAHATGEPSTGVTYDSGTLTKTGVVTVTSSGPATDIATEAPVVTATAVTGNNTAAFNPTLTVTLPTSALAGDYTGTVTTSVL